MNRDRELNQFKYLVLIAVIVYPVWLVYGLLNDSYVASVSVGVASIWGIWFMYYTKRNVQKTEGFSITKNHWYSLDVSKSISFPALASSLIVAIFFGAVVLFALGVVL